MKKISLLGDYQSNNLGDPLLFDCTKYLLESVGLEDIVVEYYDFFARSERKRFIRANEDLGKIHSVDNNGKVYKIARKIIVSIGGEAAPSILLQTYKFQRRKAEIERYYMENLAGSDLIVIIGAGTIKYHARTDFSPYYDLVVKYAQRKSIPVIVSSAGVESKFIQKDIRCKRFKHALSNPTIRMITTRDDIDELKKYVNNRFCEITKVADFGIYANEVYGIEKTDSKCVGIGIIASSRFSQFKKGITRKDYFDTIISLTELLDKENLEWRFFTNGDIEDTMDAHEICKLLGKTPETVLAVPTTPFELVKTISGFMGIITSRLHSCIVAYSLNIPFVAISWNNKLEYFAENIGCPERIITKERLNVNQIYSQYREAISIGFDQDLKKEYKETGRQTVKKYFHFLGD